MSKRRRILSIRGAWLLFEVLLPFADALGVDNVNISRLADDRTLYNAVPGAGHQIWPHAELAKSTRSLDAIPNRI
jgi:hypothetical protein